MAHTGFARVRHEMGENPDHDLAVHQSRRALKRVRALLRLARPAIGARDFKAEDTVVRDIGRLLAPLRDTRVTLDTIEAVHPGGCPVLTGRLAERHRSLMEAAWADDAISAAVTTSLQGIETRWATLFSRIEGHGFAAVRSAVARTHRRGRKRMTRAIDHPGADNFHDWRKEVKCLRYQLEAMHPADDEALAVSISGLDDLGETLGLEHDLTVLGQCASAEGGCGDELAGLLEKLDSRAAELRASALTMGPEHFGKKTGDYMRSLEPLIGTGGRGASVARG